MPGLLRTSFMVVWAVMLGSPFSITAPAGRASSAQQTQHHRDDSFCLFHVPFLSPGTALIAFSRTEDYNMRLHRRHRLVFVLLYHTRRYCQNKSVRKIHAL